MHSLKINLTTNYRAYIHSFATYAIILTTSVLTFSLLYIEIKGIAIGMGILNNNFRKCR
jgi:hypothetical protein